VSAHGNRETQRFNGQTTEDECRPRSRMRGRKQDERGNGEKEAGWHDEQSREFHGRSLFVPKEKQNSCRKRNKIAIML
jgi:hypothetical protein